MDPGHLLHEVVVVVVKGDRGGQGVPESLDPGDERLGPCCILGGVLPDGVKVPGCLEPDAYLGDEECHVASHLPLAVEFPGVLFLEYPGDEVGVRGEVLPAELLCLWRQQGELLLIGFEERVLLGMACAGRPFVYAGGWHYLFLVWGGEREGETVSEGGGGVFIL